MSGETGKGRVKEGVNGKMPHAYVVRLLRFRLGLTNHESGPGLPSRHCDFLLGKIIAAAAASVAKHRFLFVFVFSSFPEWTVYWKLHNRS